ALPARRRGRRCVVVPTVACVGGRRGSAPRPIRISVAVRDSITRTATDSVLRAHCPVRDDLRPRAPDGNRLRPHQAPAGLADAGADDRQLRRILPPWRARAHRPGDGRRHLGHTAGLRHVRSASGLARGRRWDRPPCTGPQHRRRAADLLVARIRFRAAPRPSPGGVVRLLVAVPGDRDSGLRAVRIGGLPATRWGLMTLIPGLGDGLKRLLVLAMVLTVACGNGPNQAKTSPSSAASPAVSASPLPFPSPAPGGPTPVPPLAIVCTSQIPAGHQLALVTLRAVQGIVVRDVTDLTHPVTRCGLSGGSNLRFINSTRISYIVTSSGDLGAAGSLYLVDLATSTTSLVRAWASGGYASWVYSWSHDGQRLSYLSSDGSGVKWHVLSAAGDKVLASMGTVPGRGVNLDNDDAIVGFSADGQFVAVEETFTAQKGAQTSTPPIQIVRLS